jgi:hypothetical protein
MGIFRRPTPPWAQELLLQMAQLKQGMGKLMALVEVDQTDLDTLATNLEAAVTSVGTEITNLEAALTAAGTPPPAGSLDGLNSALTALQALEVPAPAPSV